MKTLLNLLPEAKKDAIQRGLRLRFFLWQVFLLFLLEALYLSILFGIYFTLSFQLKTYGNITTGLDAASRGEEALLTEYEQKFRDTNERVGTVGRIDNAHLYFTEAFFLLDTVLPSGIVLSRISSKDYTIMLAGTAGERDDILVLDERLKRLECVRDVHIPLSNLFSQKNVEFQMDFSIKPECLRKTSL